MIACAVTDLPGAGLAEDGERLALAEVKDTPLMAFATP